MKIFDKDEKGNVKANTKNAVILFGGIALISYLIVKYLPWNFDKK
jgi:hypothetical protein